MAVAGIASRSVLMAIVAMTLATLAAAEPTTTVRLTSPLGRTGLSGTIRIVAQVVTSAPGGIVPVRFYVDDKLLGEDTDGAPYFVEWVDENPYEAREIRAEVTDPAGNIVVDRVKLEPLEVVEETQVASVLVEATVADREGRSIASLRAGDFSLFEDDKPQTLDLVQLQTLPTLFTLLIDGSQSMSRRIDLVRGTARRVTARLRPDDMVAVVPFRKEIGPLTGPTNDAATIAAAIEGIKADGGTAILDTLASLPDVFKNAAGRQVIILVTDGYDEHSHTGLAYALKRVKELNATVFVIGIGGVAGVSMKGEALLRQIAKQTGGRAFFPSREEQLPDVYDTIVADVHSRYLLTYTPAHQELDGRFRKIHVAVTDPQLLVRARDGYFAPTPPPIRPTIEFSASSERDIGATLALDDLELMEDNVPQTVDVFQEANAPISIALALDASGSIKPVLEPLKEAARTFVAALRPTDPLALVQFADTVTFAHWLSTDRQTSNDAINGHHAAGGTALWDALHDSIALLERQTGRTAVVVVTDGRDENNPGTAPGSRHTLDELLAKIGETDTTVYAIGLGAKVDRAALQRVADASGGAAYFPQDVAALPAEYRRVIDDLRRRYVVTYTSTNYARDGAWRTVTIGSRKPGFVIRSRRGYSAPTASSAATQQ
ncbi:MAG: VWA domain-containing protein [Acidobacteriota bacterium]